MKKKILIPLLVVLVLAVAGFVGLPLLRDRLPNGQTQTLYQTEAAKNDDITAYVGATGAVQSNQSANVVWQTSGRVAAVQVQKGELAAVNQVLADLEQTSLAQNVIMAQADLLSARKNMDDILNNRESRSNAQLALVQAQQALDDAEKESESKLYRRASQETIDIARANLINANEALSRAEGIYDQTKGAGEASATYAAGLSQYAKARQDQTKAEYNLNYVQDLPDPLSVEEVYAKLEQAKARLLSARTEWERIKDGPDTNDIAAAQTRVAAAQATLNLTHLSAPFTGTITDIAIKPGDLISAGKVAFQIDDISRLLVVVQVSEVDINKVSIGQYVGLTFDAINGGEYSGKVSDIAASGANTAGAVNFNVTVEIADADPAVKPGMTAAVNIAVSHLSDVLQVPSRAVRTVNGQRVVYKLINNQPVEVEVTLGASYANYSQITSGDIKDGDLVILNPPAQGLGVMGGRSGGAASPMGEGQP